MTNILAAITVALVTNVSERIVEPNYHYGCLVLGCKDDHTPPKQKHVTETVKRVMTCAFEHHGEKIDAVVREEVLSKTNKIYVAATEWRFSHDENLTPTVTFNNFVTNFLMVSTNGWVTFTNARP